MQALLDTLALCQDMPRNPVRVFHGRGGHFAGLEHLTLDWWDPVWLLTSFRALSETELSRVHEALVKVSAPLNWVYQCREPGAVETRLMAGSVPDPHVVQEAGAQYLIHLLRGQNHGLFLDMAVGRAWVNQQASALKVLNLFAYTCGFSVAALTGGASEVINIDMAASALSIGQKNHALNGLGSRAHFWAHDIFSSWGKIGRHGPYDLIIVDPPSHQKGSFVATKDYPRLMRRLPGLLTPGGRAMLCLNAPELGSDFLQHAMAREAPSLNFQERLPNPSGFEDQNPEKSLKVLIYQAPA